MEDCDKVFQINCPEPREKILTLLEFLFRPVLSALIWSTKSVQENGANFVNWLS